MAKQSAKDLIQKLQTRYRGKGAKLFIAGMALLLVLRIIVYGTETTFTPPPPPETTPYTFDPKITTDTQAVQRVQQMAQPMPEFRNSQYEPLASFNMFDPKLIQTAAQRRTNAEELTQRAMNALRAGQLEEAGRLVQSALDVLPSFKPANDLQADIQNRLGVASQPGSAPPAGDVGSTATAQATLPGSPAPPPAPVAP